MGIGDKCRRQVGRVVGVVDLVFVGLRNHNQTL